MKRILLLFLLFYLAMLQPGLSQTQEQLAAFKASSPLFQSKYSKANVWDVYRSPANAVAGVSWHLYFFAAPYDASTGSAINWGTSNNRYLQFDLVQSSSGNYTDDVWSSGDKFNIVLKLYESNGTFVKNLCTYGAFMGFGDKGFLFEQDDYFGTFFANHSYVTNASVDYTPTTGVLTKLSELLSYKYSPQLIKPTAGTTSFIYNGLPQGISIVSNSIYTITGTLSAVNVGTYTVTISLNDKVDNSWSDNTKDDVIINWSIAKATYNMSAAGWDYSEAFTWDGTEKTVSVTGLPSGVTVTEYTGNTATAVGSYSATAVLAYDQINYNKPSVDELNWKIETLKVSKPVVDAGNLTYNGIEQGIDIPVSSYYSVTGITSSVNAGNYTATISLNDKVNTAWTDGSVDDIPISWSIGKATYNMSAAAWDYSKAFTWDGTEKTVSVTGLPLGVTVTEYSGNTATAVGSYSATAVLAYDVWNYFEPLIPSLQWMIERGYLNLNIIELWDNVLAVSNGEKYEDIRNATFRWYRDGVLLQGNKQYISFEGAIPAGAYRAEVFVEGKLAVSLDYTVVSAIKAKVYPNPLLSGDCLVVEMGEERPGNEMAQVLNMSGFPVRASVERQFAGYRITGLTTPGTYFVRVSTSERTIATLKVIVK